MNLKNKILVFDDIIDLDYQNKIKHILTDDGQYKGFYFPWYFTPDVTGVRSSDSQRRSAFFHGFVIEKKGSAGIIDSAFHELFIPLILNVCDKLNRKQMDILQGRSFFQLPLNYKGERRDTPHIDTLDDHFVMLYYVCDSDGDTLIYNEKSKSDIYTLQKRVTPKQGRVVLFDGSYYHTGEQPINNMRCAVNYNLR
tara:strand:- start:657 stop:1244 length:588 start_codon:yes stop_codon:yes gene_type:complete